jgi:hypothetical protein
MDTIYKRNLHYFISAQILTLDNKIDIFSLSMYNFLKVVVAIKNKYQCSSKK